MSTAELQEKIGLESNVDLVTVSQAMHWFDLSRFYAQVKWVLKKPDGVLAAWCYTSPEVNPGVDSVFDRLYNVDAVPYFEMGPRRMVDERYETIDFPFERLDAQHNGPLQFECEKVMDLELYMTYLRSWSSYQAAKEEGVELLSNDVIKGFTVAWGGDSKSERVVKFPIYLRIWRVGQ